MSNPLRVLIVEDSADAAALLLLELRRGGYSVTFEQVDTPAAMEAALDQHAWDIVVADHAMPYFSAPAALTLLQRRGLDLPFIIVSGTIGEEVAVLAMKAGAHDYIMKDKLARLTPVIERELREAEVRRERRRALALATRLSRILENSSNEIYVFDDASLHFVQVNQGAQRNLGYTMEELERMTPLDLMPELSAAQFAESLQPLRAGTREQVVFETVQRRKNGSTYPVEVRLHCSPAETPPICAAIILDISERKQAEQTLYETREAERRRIADELHDVVFRNLLTTCEAMQVTQAKARDAGVAGELAGEIASLRQAMQGLRDAVYNLRLSQPRLPG
jgi:PAS domain S-box-containing protein